MQRRYLLILSSVLALSLVACQSTQTPQNGASVAVDIRAPLNVPSLSQFKETPARTLQGQYIKQSWADVPAWDQDTTEHLWLALINNCKGLMRPISGSLSLPSRANPRTWQAFCQKVATLQSDQTPAQVRRFMEDQLQPWKLAAQGMATGYYEPVVRGSRARQGQYQWPMYGIPKDLLTIDLGTVYPELVGKRVRGKLEGNRVVPYDTRAQIGKNINQPPVIVWLDDPIEAFFLQVQGSGRVQLENGEAIRLAYGDHNGRPYSSIGRWLIDKKELTASQASMQGIKEWAKNNPSRLPELLNSNQAMVFFKEESMSDALVGPKGSYSIPLIAERAVAVDPNFIPLGTPLFLSSSYPGTQKPLQRFVFAQDTGSAIKGASRIDYFWGSGYEAGQQAGKMKQDAWVWLLWPKQAGAPSAR